MVWKIARKLKSLLIRSLGYMEFRINLLLNKPYFGRYLSAGQTWNTRKGIMKRLLEDEMSKSKSEDYKILEICSWAGESTVLWDSVCKKFNKGKVFCIDTWRAADNSPKLMKKAVKRDKIMKLFLHNIRVSKSERIIHIRATSDEVAKILKLNTFDFIYVDGDHSYSQFKRDLINYSKFCKHNGVICGDDLEINPAKVNLNNTKKYSEEDYIKDINTGEFFHPGITLGIIEFFGNDISMLNGFWAMRKLGNKYKKINLD